ncbi:glycosyltransferase family 2 protein [Actibacterium sp. D379-3]
MTHQPEVTILLATHNGADLLGPQLDSFLAQTHRRWRLIASDDGSTDGTPDLLTSFAKQNPDRDITLCRGPCRGFARNFMHLFAKAGVEAAFAALSDQDDVWLPGKLDRAIAALQALPADRPALYCGRTWICDKALTPQGRSPLFRRPPCFENALVQNIGGGNTMVLNRAALALARAASAEAGAVVSHDWWLYQLVTGVGGHVVYDPEPMVLYRQHRRNLIGANRSCMARARRAVMLFQGRFRQWNDVNIRALAASAHRFTPENRALLATFARTRSQHLPDRIRLLRHAGLHRQTVGGDASLWCATTLGLI